jgi:hypothetical protein
MTDRMGEGNSEGAVSGNFEESSVGHFCEWETNFWSAFSLELDLDDNGEDPESISTSACVLLSNRHNFGPYWRVSLYSHVSWICWRQHKIAHSQQAGRRADSRSGSLPVPRWGVYNGIQSPLR